MVDSLGLAEVLECVCIEHLDMTGRKPDEEASFSNERALEHRAANRDLLNDFLSGGFQGDQVVCVIDDQD